jgi:hypothetical protein
MSREIYEHLKERDQLILQQLLKEKIKEIKPKIYEKCEKK